VSAMVGRTVGMRGEAATSAFLSRGMQLPAASEREPGIAASAGCESAGRVRSFG